MKSIGKRRLKKEILKYAFAEREEVVYHLIFFGKIKADVEKLSDSLMPRKKEYLYNIYLELLERAEHSRLEAEYGREIAFHSSWMEDE